MQHRQGYHYAYIVNDNNTKTHKKYTSYHCLLDFIVQKAINQIFLFKLELHLQYIELCEGNHGRVGL